MQSRARREWDSLADFSRTEISLLGRAKTVFQAGQGPGVLVMHELPGITPEVARFARIVRDAGYTVFLPVLTGTPGRPFSPGYLLAEAAKVCVGREFWLFGSAERTSPAVDWLRALAAKAHKDCGGKGIGVVGMCLTGNFGLAMMLEPAVRAPVLSQPSLPTNQPNGLHIAPGDLADVKARMDAEDLTALAYRFAGDRLCPAARFAALEAALGERIRAVTIPDAAAAPGTGIAAHSVLTTHLIDAAGEPTRQAVDEILDFFAVKLR